MGKNNKKGPNANVFKVAGAKSLKKTKAKAVNLGLKNDSLQTAALLRTTSTKFKRKLGCPVKYQRKPGSRRYIDYTEQQLQECLAAIKANKFTQRDAADYYNIPWSTIKNKLANRNPSKPGRLPIFSAEEEQIFVSRIATLSEFGFPLSNFDIKMVIKDYLTSQNKTVPIFRNNLPGRDWLKYFFDRHKHLCNHLESKFNRARSRLSESVISNFIDQVAETTDNVPPQNIYCFYELSFREDPKKKDVIYRRGVKYPEMTAIETTKTKYSVMFCGNAVGEAIPPYITYMSQPGCSTWTENGPEGARYNCTKSGWMNSATFESWFLIHLLPVLKKRRGHKVLIGDNVSSHINGRVLTYCEKYNISFLCLPHKSTHVLHPLYYAYYLPIRTLWLQLLLDWQCSQIAKKMPTLLNEDFPYLLKKALNALPDTAQNIVIGFEKCGIFPVDKEEPLYRLPHLRVIDNHMLKSTDYEFDHFEAGPSHVKTEPLSPVRISKEECESDDSEIDTSIEIPNTFDVADSDVYIVVVKGDEVLQIPLQFADSPSEENILNVAVDDHVIVNHGTHNVPGKVLSVCKEGAYIHCMKRWKSLWRWPTIMREQLYSWDEIISIIDTPKLVNKGCFLIPELVGNMKESK